MTATAPLYPLEHTRSLTGRVHLKQGPRAALVTQGQLVALLARVRRNTTGVVRTAPGCVTLDESQLVNLIDTYYPEDDEQRPDIDADRYVLGFDDEDAHEVQVGPFTDEHGMDRTPGQSPTGGAL